MPKEKIERLHGWGRTPIADCLSFRPEKQRELHEIVTNHADPVIARGMGRAYGDAAMQPTGVIRTGRLDHFIEFDPHQGIVRAQAGVTLADIMAICVPKGWLPPVIPGTRHVTLGGAFACNIHGKNHYREGDFAEHVPSIRLLLASGESIECSPESHGDIFWATAGGMGMTGIIEEVSLKLKPIASASLSTVGYRVSSIEDMVGAFEHYRNQSDHMVGWIDPTGKAEHIGCGVFSAANHITTGDGGLPLATYAPKKARVNIPFPVPPLLLNRYTMALYNRWRFRKYDAHRKTENNGFDHFFHPLDGIGNWNRLYGANGLLQYQCVLPETPDIARNLRALLTAIGQHRMSPFLAVIKYHRESKGMLTFPMRGYSLALDFLATPRVRSLLPQLDRWVTDHNGRVYLAKDASLSAESFTQMYKQAGHDWHDLICDLDPHGRFASMMSKRLRWKSVP